MIFHVSLYLFTSDFIEEFLKEGSNVYSLNEVNIINERGNEFSIVKTFWSETGGEEVLWEENIRMTKAEGINGNHE